MPVCAYTTSSFYQIKPCLSTFSEKVCIKRTIRQQFGRAAPDLENRRKHHLHRKTQVLLCELSNAYALLISRSDLQCFSHEDGCFAAGNENQGAARLNCCAALRYFSFTTWKM